MLEFKGAVEEAVNYSLVINMMNWKEELDISDIGAARIKIKTFLTEVLKTESRCNVFLMPVLGKNMKPEQLQTFLQNINDLPIIGFKLFPPGQSTNSGYAPSTEQAGELIDVLSKSNMTLAYHLEDPNASVEDKERSAVENILPQLEKHAGDMRRTIEHVSTEETLKYVFAHPNMYCTITPQHIGLSLEMLESVKPRQEDDAALYLQRHFPGFYCKPLIPSEKNRRILLDTWLSGIDKIILGTDSAPHETSKKLPGPGAAAGIDLGDLYWSYLAASGASPEKVIGLIRLYTKNGAEFYNIDLSGMKDYVPAPGMTDLQKKMMGIREAYLER